MIYNLTQKQFVFIMQSFGNRFEQSRPSLGPDYGSPITEMTNQEVIEKWLELRADRGLVC